MKFNVFTVLAVAIALFLSACGKSDGDLQKAAMDKLAGEKIVGVTIAVKEGTATLTGQVPDATAKTKAETLVKSVDGIKAVTNALSVPAPLPTPEPVSPDKVIENGVVERLKKMSIDGVVVAVKDGEVTLTGKVDKAKVAQVMMIANEGKPKKVINNLNK